jgi:integrase
LSPCRATANVVAPIDVDRSEGEQFVGTKSLRDQLREGRLALPAVGAVIGGGMASLPYLVVDDTGAVVEPAGRYLRDLALSDRSPLTVRSYAMDLLRWWRLLAVLEVGWDVATTDEVAVLVGWLRHAPNPQRSNRHAAAGVNIKTGKPVLASGYAPSTVNHALSVLSGFYAFHAHYGRGPVVNPVPPQARRRALLGHRSPLEAVPLVPRARLRQRMPQRSPRAIADPLWQELVDAMTCVRDKALLAFYVSTGARASELLGMRGEHVDWSGQRIWVMTKGTRLLEAVPASPVAFTLLAVYFDQDGAPQVGQPVWRSRRGLPRALTYWAARRILQRANAKLGTNWTLHDARHTAATRMANDPALSLPEVQTVMRHAHLATTQRYLGVNVEDLMAKMQQHYQRPAQPPLLVPIGYAPDDVATVFGG